MTSRLRSFGLFILLFCAFGVSAAQAHNLNVFAISTGDTIEGYVYFTGGTRARAAEIELHADDGAVVAAARTDQNGAFAIRVSHRTPYVVQANTGDGHIATFTLTEDEFSENLPPAKNASDITASFVTDNTPDAAVAPTKTSPSSSATAPIGLKALTREELTSLINHAVARQIGPLREEVNAYRNDVRMSDIMGGIGVIIGIFGILAWVRARKQTSV
ncbi:hypothetical protein [Thalassospira povalilytica]|uniref:hypothetical protein n=1 Tax=Thalassospira povalilytica TaxID=732237 RepID=UPI001D1892FB|nr:hypothetical protein [Thalassospira povalilytica]MCC4240597.1 hypothetical protein [Thalassospira povalilytica]